MLLLTPSFRAHRGVTFTLKNSELHVVNLKYDSLFSFNNNCSSIKFLVFINNALYYLLPLLLWSLGVFPSNMGKWILPRPSPNTSLTESDKKAETVKLHPFFLRNFRISFKFSSSCMPLLSGVCFANTILAILAYMATSGGHFSRPSGMGSFWS